MEQGARRRIVQALEEAQRHHQGYLPPSVLRTLAAELGVPSYHLYGLATFFPHFRLEPPPVLDVRVCADMSCRLRGGTALLRELETAAATRPSNEVTVTTVSCLGRCDGAPAAAVNDQPYWGLADGLRTALVCAVRESAPLPRPPSLTPLSGLRVDPYQPGDARFAALRRLVESGEAATVLATLRAAQLRGMGGAGFSAAIKWEAVRNAPGDEKYVVCNADESEPGTIKDRGILTSVPHLVVEGMAVAGVLTGASRGIIYIRHEYGPEAEILAQTLEMARREGVLGEHVLGSSHAFDTEIFTSPGGYICGEETALLEVIEGRRAQPRLKPPFPVTSGLYGKPTVINNVETLAHVPAILLKGAEWYLAQGRAGAPGMKFVGVSGHVRHPGVYEIALGTTLREVIDRYAGGMLDGHALKAVAPSGPSSGFLPATLADTPVEWAALQKAGSMLGSSAVVAIGEGTCMVDMALNVARFFARESCGKCWPCRVGSEKIVQMLEAVTEGTAAEGGLAAIDDLASTLRLTSICGLGQVVPSPIVSVLRHFPDEVDAHLRDRRCPAGTCPMRPGSQTEGMR